MTQIGPRLPRSSWWSLPFELVIRAYQITLSPFVGGQCRFYPTCSHYGLDAYRAHGVLRGTLLTARRILRCHPFTRGGYDPVPPVSRD
jgi:putative membrane protein insertion efficiency factor